MKALQITIQDVVNKLKLRKRFLINERWVHKVYLGENPFKSTMNQYLTVHW